MSRTRLTTLGDSFVAGYGDDGPDGRRGWVVRLADQLGLPAAGLTNLGRFGATTQDVVAEQLDLALVNKPPLVGVVVGVNDLLGDYETERFAGNVARILTALRGANTVVFTATYPDIPRIEPLPASFRELVRGRFAEANTLVRRLVREHGVLCLDIAADPGWRAPDMWSADGLHPSPKGHKEFAGHMADLVGAATGTGGTW